MNKKNLWFLTLFSLILVMGVYYITLPSEIFSDNETVTVNKEVEVKVSETNKLVAKRVERDENISTVMEELQDTIVSNASTTEEKNSAFEELQLLNLSKGKETYLEDKILDNFKLNSYVEINNDKIDVTIASKEHDNELVNKIMTCIEEEFEDEKNITIKFES